MTRHILIDAQQLIVHIFRLSHDYRLLNYESKGRIEANSIRAKIQRSFRNVRIIGVGRTCKYQAGLRFRGEIWKYNMDIT